MDAQQVPMANKSDAEQNKWMGVIAYFGILSVIPFFAAKKSPFAQHHAKQGLTLFLAWVLIGIASMFLPWTMEDLVDLVAGIAIFVLGIMGIMNAWKGTMWEMPVLGSIAKSVFGK